MKGNSPATHRDQKEKQTSFLEVVNIEKLLWATIKHKGISHSEVQDLYRKARAGYENVILNDYQVVDLQDVEYSLWKLHYKHIDEYRKKIKKVSASSESTNNLNSYVEGFKSFLSEVAEFYKDLITKFRKTCGLSIEPGITQKCHYACHRFLVCLGDLSRYTELCKKPDVQKWATAATYYLEATTVWPHSGNPQNQLALLATYIGDDFLALYHCIRSLAVKEPFPDARDNIMLLFEKNKSLQLQSLSTDAHIDFSKPLKRLSSQIKSSSSMDSTNISKLGPNEHIPPVKTDLWPLFVRMISFFLVKASFEDLPHTFASTMKELEALLALNDIELNSALEPYEQFDSSRKGPYRALQAVTILIFVIQNLIKTPQVKGLNGEKDEQLSACIVWAWTCAFSWLGHMIQRCVTAGNGDGNCSSLLPAVLVFVEWYVGVVDHAETYGKDEKVCNAKSYFFGALVELLNRIDVTEHETVKPALWEDHELIGFEPVSRSNDSLDFSTCSENRAKYEVGNSMRVHRVVLASVKIADRLKGSSQSLIVYDQSARKFNACKDSEKFLKKNERETSPVEEEEVILFKPLTRYNSEPFQISNDEPVDQSEDGLRRSASLFGTQESSKRGPPYSAGPPSLSAWVLNQETVNPEQQRGLQTPKKPELAPIAEISTSSLANMSIAEATIGPPYVAPIPSAPFLPEDPVWLRGSDQHGILGAPPVSRFSNLSPPHETLDLGSGVPGFVDAYRPPVFGLSSSEWLYRYTNNLNLELGNGNIPNSNHHWPAGNVGNFHGYDGGSRFDLIDRWGNPLLTNRMVYFENPSFVYGRDDKLLHGYQRLNGGGGGEVRAEQPHMKEREWHFQGESH